MGDAPGPRAPIAPTAQAIQYPYVDAQHPAAFQSIPPSLVPFSRPWYIAKLVLGGGSILISAVLIAVAIALVSLYGGYSDAYVDIIMVSVVGGIAIIWQVAENITICARPAHRGIHPGAHVGLHLLIAIGAALSMSFIAVFLSEDAASLQDYQSVQNCDPSTDFDCSSDGYYYPSSYSYFGDLSYSDLQTYVAMESALVGLAALLMIVHIILFVRACIETHQRNSVTRTVILIPAGAAPPNTGAPMYYMPAPPEMARMSYAAGPQYVQDPRYTQQLQPQMQQAPPMRTSVVSSLAPSSSARQLSTIDTPPPDQNAYGYYAPAPQQSPSPVAGRDNRSRPESSVVSPSPVSEARQFEKAKQPDTIPEREEASGSGGGMA